ncbi:MAG: carbon-nitrogen family hydrolase [Syntrophales bacterium]|nr:carbon-nitrogen family hydrolase [Syntrophales bacterium]
MAFSVTMDNSTLTIALVQMDVISGSPSANLSKAEEYVRKASEKGVQLICFPELWTTGFDWESLKDLVDTHQKMVDRIGELAKQNNIWIGGSLLSRHESGGMTNTFYLFDNRGKTAGVYHKVHLFPLAGEDKYLTPGNKLVTAHSPWGKIGLAVCYDLRFPEMFRIYALSGAKLCLIPAAFPHPRLEHWQILLRARAIENQMYVVGVNQVGTKTLGGVKATFFGHSAIIDPFGETVFESRDEFETFITTTIDLNKVDEIRSRMPFLKSIRPEVYTQYSGDRQLFPETLNLSQRDT